MLKIKKISKRYEHSDFELLAKQIVFPNNKISVLLGKNGSGKSTFIKCLLGITQPDECEFSLLEEQSNLQDNLGCIVEGQDCFYPFLDPVQNATYFSRLRGCPPDFEYINELISTLGLEKARSQKIQSLSTGNQRKATLLAALAHRPKYVFLDEPTLGLDLESIERVIELLRYVADRTTLLVTSHDTEFIRRVCDKLFYIENGELSGVNISEMEPLFCRLRNVSI